MVVETSPTVIHLEELLAPISAEFPAGQDLRYEGTYDHIRVLRREDDPLPQGVWQTEAKRAEWTRISEICTDALQHQTKDLQIAAWLLEAWLHMYGFAGLSVGFELLSELLQRYWDTVYPAMEEGDLDYRAAPFHWINEKLVVELKRIPIAHPQEPDGIPLAWSDWELACLQASAVGRHPKGNAALTQDDFQRALHLTPFATVQDDFAAIARSLEACSRTESLLDTYFGRGGPSLQRFYGTLEKLRDFLATFVRQMGGEPASTLVESVQEEAIAPSETDVSTAGSLPYPEIGPITSRAEAYHWLAAAAEYLARTEPHSPTPYLVRRAIRWGHLSLDQLLPELIRNQNELTEVFRLLQINEDK
jgi:type VI secretion system protein ImpA